MNSNTSKLLIVLLLVVCFAAYTKLSNPHKQYSTQAYWKTASLSDVQSIPDAALEPGNINGPVLMWAAAATSDPAIIDALIGRGASIYEEDVLYSGTPLFAAASYNSNPQIIDKLVSLGADVNAVAGSNNKTPLIIAAELNKAPEIIERLIHHGADVSYKDLTNRNALEQAIRFENQAAIGVLEKYL